MDSLDARHELFYTIIGICCLASIVGSCFIIIMYFSFRQLRLFSFKLVVYLSIADIGHNLGNQQAAYGLPIINEELCMYKAILDNFFALATVMWTTMITVTLYLGVVKQKKNLQHYELRFHIICWLFPLVVTLLPLCTDSFGKADIYICWIPLNEIIDYVWRVVCLYLPVWLAIVFNIVAHVKIIKIINYDIAFASEECEFRMELTRRLKLYPVVLPISYLAITSLRLLSLFNISNFYFELIAAAMYSLLGLLNSMVYGSNVSVRSSLSRCFGAQQENRSYDSFDESSNLDSLVVIDR